MICKYRIYSYSYKTGVKLFKYHALVEGLMMETTLLDNGLFMSPYLKDIYHDALRKSH